MLQLFFQILLNSWMIEEEVGKSLWKLLTSTELEQR